MPDHAPRQHRRIAARMEQNAARMALDSAPPVQALQRISRTLNAHPSPAVQLVRLGFGSSTPRFQPMFTSRTGLQGQLLGHRRQADEARRAEAAPPRHAEFVEPELPGPPELAEPEPQGQEFVEPEPPGQAEAVPLGGEQALDDELAALPQPVAQPLDQAGARQGTFDAVSARLGIPINGTSWGDPAGPMAQSAGVTPEQAEQIERGNSAALALYNALNDHMNRNHGAVPATGDARVFRDAAVGCALGAGVCDNFSAVTAVEARSRGLDNVHAENTDSHRYTIAGDRLVDPWAESTHMESARNPQPNHDAFAANLSSEGVTAQHAINLADAQAGLEAVRAADPQHEANYQTMHAALIVPRANGGWGSAAMRTQIAALQAARLNRLRDRRR